MITPPTQSLKGCRADFDDLVQEGEEQYQSPFLGAGVFIYRSPENQAVVMFSGHRVGKAERSVEETAREIIEASGVGAGDHLVASVYRGPDGLDQALDTAGEGKIMITMLVRREMSEEEKAVPKPDPVPPVTVSLVMGEKDFDQLTNSSTRWNTSFEGSWAPQLDRFENMSYDYDQDPSPDWKVAYWLGTEYSAVLLAGAFLRGQGCEYEVLWDMAENPDPQYAILTNFMTASWKQSEEQERVREAQKEAQLRGLLED